MGNDLMIKVDEADNHKYADKKENNQGKIGKAKLLECNVCKKGCNYFNKRITPRDADVAVPTFSAQQEITDDGDVIKKAYRVTASGAAGGWGHNGNAFRNTAYANIQETPDCRTSQYNKTLNPQNPQGIHYHLVQFSPAAINMRIELLFPSRKRACTTMPTDKSPTMRLLIERHGPNRCPSRHPCNIKCFRQYHTLQWFQNTNLRHP
jgi:hypothetical protein